MNRLSSKYLLFLSRALLGLIFIVASSDKIAHPELFASSIMGYKLAPIALVNLLAVVIPWLEMVSGIFLLTGLYARSASLVISLLLASFMAAITFAMLQGLDIDCGCFGAGRGAPVGWLRLIEDFGMLLLAGHIYYFSAKEPGVSRG